MTAPDPKITKTCATCRHVMTDKRPKIVDATGFGDQMEFEDEDEIVYTCKAPEGASEFSGRQIGISPIICPGWVEAKKGVTDEERAKLDEMEARFAARAKDKGERE